MVHAITLLKCDKGHILPIQFDDNKCGCHSDGKPCIIISCSKCLDEWMKLNDEAAKDFKMPKINIPLDDDGVKEVEKLK